VDLVGEVLSCNRSAREARLPVLSVLKVMMANCSQCETGLVADAAVEELLLCGDGGRYLYNDTCDGILDKSIRSH